MISTSMQDYLKAIYEIAERSGQVTTSELAARLDVTPTSATGMMKKLAELRLIEHEPYHGARLTEGGRRIAVEMIRHHRLIELYLAEALGVPWDQVHVEAERLEHVISEDLERRMAEALGHPSHDPHGAPIPSVDGEIHRQEETIVLTDCRPGSRVVVVEVDDRDPALLRYLADHGIRPGVELQVLRFDPFGGSVVVEAGGATCSLGTQAAADVHVRHAAAMRASGASRARS